MSVSLNGAAKRAKETGRAASQWVKPKLGRKVRRPSRIATHTSFPLNSKVQTR